MKTCTKCGELKSLDDFYNTKTVKRDGKSAQCKDCRRKRQKEYEIENADIIKQRIKKDAPQRRIRAQKWRDNNKERNATTQRANQLLSNYGLTMDQYDAILVSQDNHCRICPRQYTHKNKLHVDHDHSCCPGRKSCGLCIRGLVCGGCNVKLAWLENYESEIVFYLGRKIV